MLELKRITQFPESEPRTLELKHNVIRGAKPQREASTILPGGQQYLTNKCRLMLPQESLIFQGIHAPASILDQFEDRILQDLSGSAFETSCCMGTLIVGIAMLAKISKPEPCGSPEEDDDTDSSQSSLFRRPQRPRLC